MGMIEMRMRCQRAGEKRLVVDVLTIAWGSILIFVTPQVVHAIQQSQIVTCTGSIDSCQTVTCIDNEPCHTFESNSDPLAYGHKQNDATVMQPPENNAIVTQPEEDLSVQPLEGTGGTTLAPEDDMEIIEGIMDDQ
jgi:hypothetical protein